MKTSLYTFIASFGMVALSSIPIPVSAQNSEKAQTIKLYNWNHQTSQWEHHFSTFKRFNNSGLEVSKTTFNVTNAAFEVKDSIEYFTPDFVARTTQYNWNQTNSGFTPSNKREYTYTTDGQEASNKYYIRNNNSWVLERGTERYYNVVNLRTEINQRAYDVFFSSQWRDQMRTTIDRNNQVQKIREEFEYDILNNGVLYPKELTTFGGWIDEANNQPSESAFFLYQNNAYRLSVHFVQAIRTGMYVRTITDFNFQPSKTFIHVASLDGKSIRHSIKVPGGLALSYEKTQTDTSYFERWYDYNTQNQLEQIHEELTIFNHKKDIARKTSRFWTPQQNWELDMDERYTHTYNSQGQKTETIYEIYNTTNQSFVRDSKMTFENYWTAPTPVNTTTGWGPCSMTSLSGFSGNPTVGDILNIPNGVAKIGNILLVVNGSGANIDIFTTNGIALSRVGSWGSYGNSNGQLNNPQKITASDNGFIYISNAGNSKITVLSINGVQLQFLFNSPNSFQEYPTGLAAKGNLLYISETQRNRINIYSVIGTTFHLVGRYEDAGTSFGQLQQPSGLTLHDSLLYVADKSNSRIQVFKVRGTTLTAFRVFGGNGSSTGLMQFPEDVAVSGNEVYVADTQNDRIQCFYFNGSGYTFLESFGSQGSSLGRFNVLTSLALINDTLLIATDRNNYRVQLIRIPKSRNIQVSGGGFFDATQTAQAFSSGTGTYVGITWLNQNNGATFTGQNLTIFNSSAQHQGTYIAQFNTGCRAYTSKPITINIQKIEPQLSGFELSSDTLLLPSMVHVFQNLRISDGSLPRTLTTNDSIARFSRDTLYLNQEGSVTIGAIYNGNDQYLPVTWTKNVVIVKGTQYVQLPNYTNVTIVGTFYETTLSGSATSGQEITFSAQSSPVGMVHRTGSTLRIVGTGTVTISGWQEGTARYYPSDRAYRTFEVQLLAPPTTTSPGIGTTPGINTLPGVGTIPGVDTVTGIGAPEEPIVYSIAPNPVEASAALQILAPDNCMVSVYNLSGNLVAIGLGAQSRRLTESGLYLVVFEQANGHRFTRKVLVK